MLIFFKKVVRFHRFLKPLFFIRTINFLITFSKRYREYMIDHKHQQINKKMKSLNSTLSNMIQIICNVKPKQWSVALAYIKFTKCNR